MRKVLNNVNTRLLGRSDSLAEPEASVTSKNFPEASLASTPSLTNMEGLDVTMEKPTSVPIPSEETIPSPSLYEFRLSKKTKKLYPTFIRNEDETMEQYKNRSQEEMKNYLNRYGVEFGNYLKKTESPGIDPVQASKDEIEKLINDYSKSITTDETGMNVSHNTPNQRLENRETKEKMQNLGFWKIQNRSDPYKPDLRSVLEKAFELGIRTGHLKVIFCKGQGAATHQSAGTHKRKRSSSVGTGTPNEILKGEYEPNIDDQLEKLESKTPQGTQSLSSQVPQRLFGIGANSSSCLTMYSPLEKSNNNTYRLDIDKDRVSAAIPLYQETVNKYLLKKEKERISGEVKITFNKMIDGKRISVKENEEILKQLYEGVPFRLSTNKEDISSTHFVMRVNIDSLQAIVKEKMSEPMDSPLKKFSQ